MRCGGTGNVKVKKEYYLVIANANDVFTERVNHSCGASNAAYPHIGTHSYPYVEHATSTNDNINQKQGPTISDIYWYC